MLDHNFIWVIANQIAGVRGPIGNDDLKFLKQKGISVLVRLAEEQKAHVTSEESPKAYT